MDESKPTLVGWVPFAWVQILLGVLGSIAIVGYVAWKMYRGLIDPGIPLEYLALLAVPLTAGVATGVGLRRGRAWAWFVGSLVWLALAVAGLSVFFELVPVPFLAGTEPRDRMLIGASGLLSLLPWVYLMLPGARTFCGISGWRGLLLPAAQVAMCLAVVGGSSYLEFSAEQESSSQKRLKEIRQIAERGSTSNEDAEFLLKWLEEGNEEERLSSAWALGKMFRTEALPQLVRAAQEDRSSNVRINAIESISTMGGVELQPTLVELLDDDDPIVRSAAIRALGAPRFEAAAEDVGRLLTDDEPDVRATAADALGLMQNGSAVPLLQAAAGDDDPDVRTRTAFALGKLRDPDAVETLGGLLSDDSWEVRANAVQALGMIGGRSARPLVERALNDPNTYVRQAAEAAREKLR